MPGFIHTGLQVTLLLAAAATATAQDTDALPAPETTSETPAATDPALENAAPDQDPAPEPTWWWKGSFTATYKDGDLILEPDVPESAGEAHAFTRTITRPKTEFVRGEFTVSVAGQLVRHTGRYMVSRLEPIQSVRSLEDELVNPRIFRAIDDPIAGPNLRTADVRQLVEQTEGPVNAYFVYNSFDAQRLRRNLQAQLQCNLQTQDRSGVSQNEPDSESEEKKPDYIVVVDETHDYQEVSPAIVKEVSLNDGVPTVVCNYDVQKCRTEQRTATRTVTRTVIEQVEQTYTAEVDGVPEQRTRTVQVEKPVSEEVEFTYSVCVPHAEMRTRTLRNPQLLMPVNPQEQAAGRAFAPVELTSSALPPDTRVLLVNSPAEAARVYQTLRNSLSEVVAGDLPFSPAFLVDYESADK
jgi:hypothetical protein